MEWQGLFHRGFALAGRAFARDRARAARTALFPMPTFAAPEPYGLDIFPGLTA
jgi:hypothetical protein